jgi:hypothetical protein
MKLVPLAITLFVFAMSAQTVAFVDLSVPRKDDATARIHRARGGNHGGACYDCPNQDAFEPSFPLTAKLMWAVESTDPGPGNGAVEVLITNMSQEPIPIPIGVDTGSLLKAPAPGRQSIVFTVCISPCALIDFVGNSEAATSLDHPSTLLELQPGQSIVFKLPFDRRVAANKIKQRGELEGELSVLVGLFTVETDKDGEYSNGLPISVKVENSLKWTPRLN